jgi:Ni2+-binding GTPase involved in maturation of urease and hydrogenase
LERDAPKTRGDRPFLFTNLKGGSGVAELILWVRTKLGTVRVHSNTNFRHVETGI